MTKLDTGRNFITENLSPINAVVFFTTGILVPLLDLLRPVVPLLNYFAGVAVIGFLAVLVAWFMGKPRPIPTGFVATVGVCCAIFAAGAYASSKHAAGFIASKDPAIAQVQASMFGLDQKLDNQAALLADIKSGKSDDPRVALKNMGVSWKYEEFWTASRRGDLVVMELFLQGRMPLYSGDSSFLPAIAVDMGFPDITNQLALFEKYGFDLKSNPHPSISDPERPPNLYFLALERNNVEAAAYLSTIGFTQVDYIKWLTVKNEHIAKRFKGGYTF